MIISTVSGLFRAVFKLFVSIGEFLVFKYDHVSWGISDDAYCPQGLRQTLSDRLSAFQKGLWDKILD